ncbi:hypothetical protein KIPB_012324, partial [Kipferlia bialata]|eukprot:g12324.t1
MARAEWNCLVFDGQGRVVGLGSADNTIVTYDIKLAKVLDSLPLPQAASSLSLSADGLSLLVTYTEDPGLHLFVAKAAYRPPVPASVTMEGGEVEPGVRVSALPHTHWLGLVDIDKRTRETREALAELGGLLERPANARAPLFVPTKQVNALEM